MKVTYLVALEVDDISQIPTLATEIQDDLEDSGYNVTSVAPWARPSLVAPTIGVVPPSTDQYAS